MTRERRHARRLGGRSRESETRERHLGVSLWDAVRAIWSPESSLSTAERAVLTVVWRRSNFDGVSFPSVLSLAGDTDLSERTVRRALRSLELAGAMGTERSAGRLASVYIVSAAWVSRLMHPRDTNPATETGSIDNTVTGTALGMTHDTNPASEGADPATSDRNPVKEEAEPGHPGPPSPMEEALKTAPEDGALTTPAARVLLATIASEQRSPSSLARQIREAAWSRCRADADATARQVEDGRLSGVAVTCALLALVRKEGRTYQELGLPDANEFVLSAEAVEAAGGAK